MDIKDLKSFLIKRIADLSVKASASDISYLASAYETMKKAEAPDPYKSMAKVFSSALTVGVKKGERDDYGRKD